MSRPGENSPEKLKIILDRIYRINRIYKPLKTPKTRNIFLAQRRVDAEGEIFINHRLTLIYTD
jgi:hypothetical protein